ncbi:hypothetical protein GCM10025868_33890 [Angustibacter aerolatus]|uniref:ABC transmembrane type-1 domain-containing protein n=1 Tax=Angustibacter aerolatus TaxID=1162965 RepID=A0ABQ6JJS7_9ACTN|nr:ABC transporter transmembrane domain-containing protein [Angustibacter aerolatus]GMA88139.1 hypothetical protein GCM10025868_33890 [Angustibacter aerolatus]
MSVVTNDAMRFGGAYDVTARFAGAVVAYVVVAVVLTSISTPLGLLVLIGVPALTAVLGLLVKPLQRRQAAQREQAGRLTTLGADTVAGLRVLRGIGGERTFVDVYTARSEQVRQSGVRVAGVQATLDAAQVLLPGVFVVLVTWLGARLAVRGDISVGDLVQFYGLSAFLVTPLRTATETLDKATRAHVGAGRIIAVLRVSPGVLDRTDGRRADPLPDAPLHDPTSGVTIEPGLLTAVVSEHPEQSAALADRLGRFSEVAGAPVTLGGERLDLLPLEAVRRHVVVSESEPRLFTGGLREQLTGPRPVPDDEPVGGPRRGRRRRRARRAARRPRQRGRGARPLVQRRPAAAAVARPRPAHRRARAGARRADQRRRRTHRGRRRRPAARAPGRPHHRRHHRQPAAARPHRPRGVPRARRGGRRGPAPRACCAPCPPTAAP